MVNIKQNGNHLLSDKNQAEQQPEKKSFYLNILNKVTIHGGMQTETESERVESISACLHDGSIPNICHYYTFRKLFYLICWHQHCRAYPKLTNVVLSHVPQHQGRTTSFC